MRIVVSAQGLNLEKLLRAAAQEGIALRDVRREADREISAAVSPFQLRRLEALAQRYGWELAQRRASPGVRAVRLLRRRWTLALSGFLCWALVAASSHVLLAVHIEHAGKQEAAVRSVLREAGIRPGRLLDSISSDALRARLEYALPGLTFAGVRIKGSVMEVDCREGIEEEEAGVPGDGADIIAARDGVITRIWAGSGTPLVAPGQAVRAGQTLIAGYERGADGRTTPVRAQGEALARVWARGEARASLYTIKTEETGRRRRRVTLHTPFGSCIVRPAEDFAAQDIDAGRETVVGLFLPVWREIEILIEHTVLRTPRSRADAMSIAQGAAEQQAKYTVPPGADILDKSVNYSMIDNEFVYAAVVLEYETDVASRP